MPIKEADKSYDHKKIEKKIQNFWIEGDTFSKVNKPVSYTHLTLPTIA